MTLLALDLGTKTGVAYGEVGIPAARVVSETWALPSGGREDVGPFMSAFEQALSDRLMRGVTVLVYEAPFLGGKLANSMHTARRIMGLPAICEMLAYRRGIPCFECVIPTVRSHFADHGRADKEQVMRSARRRGFTIANHHEADAVACWWWAVVCRHPEFAANYDPLFTGAQ